MRLPAIAGTKGRKETSSMANLKKFVAVGIVVVALILGVTAYSVLKTPAEASRPITAIPLAESDTGSSGLSTPSQTATTSADDATATAAGEPAAATAADGPTVATAAGEPAPTSASTAATTEAAPAAADAASQVVAQIVPEESEVRFLIDEVLNGQPKTVCCRHDQPGRRGNRRRPDRSDQEPRGHDSDQRPHAYDRQ